MSNPIGAIAILVGLVVLIAAIFALITQWAWNTVMPGVFGLPELTLIQAFAINLLAGMLIKSSAPVKS